MKKSYYVPTRGYRLEPQPLHIPPYVRNLAKTYKEFEGIDWLNVGLDLRVRFEYRKDDYRPCRKAYMRLRGSLWKNYLVLATFQSLAPLFALALAVAPSVEPPPTARPDLASGLESGRRARALPVAPQDGDEVDGVSRLTKLEDVHLGPDGGLVTKKTVKKKY